MLFVIIVAVIARPLGSLLQCGGVRCVGVDRRGRRQARTIAPFYCLLAFSHAVASVCRGAGKAFVPMLVMLAIWCVLRIGYITLVMRITHELRFIYYAYPLTWAISSVIFFLYYHFSDWVHGFEKPLRLSVE